MKIEFALILKVFEFDRNLNITDNTELHIGICYNNSIKKSEETAQELVEQIVSIADKKKNYKDLKYKLINFNQTNIENIIKDTKLDILYIAPLEDKQIKEISKIACEKDICTYTGVEFYTHNGIAVGFGVENNKPKIIINLPMAKEQGADFSSRLLKMAKVIE